MTISELIQQLQELEKDGMGYLDVFITDFTFTDNPVPRKVMNIKVLKHIDKVFLESGKYNT